MATATDPIGGSLPMMDSMMPPAAAPGIDPAGLPAGAAAMGGGMGGGMGDPGALPQEPASEPLAEPPVPEPEPLDPVSAAIDGVLLLEPKEAIRRVYQLAVSAARAKAQVDAAGDALDARTYHDLTGRNPEVRFARELGFARRRLDTLAGERRRLGLLAGKGSGVADAQYAATEVAMDQVARGVLLFLALPNPEELA